MPARNQFLEADPVPLSFKREREVFRYSDDRHQGKGKFCRPVSVILMMAWLLLSQGWSQTVAPVWEKFPITSNSPNGAWIGPVLSLDGDTLYMLAKGKEVIRQGTNILATEAPGSNFFSLIKKPFDGPVIWSREMTGPFYPRAMAKMPDDGVVMVGSFKDGAVLKTNATEGVTLISQGEDDFFVARYLADGTLAWVKTAGSASPDNAVGVSVDDLGNIAVAGTIGGPAMVELATVFGQGMFLALYQPDGTMSWLRTVSGVVIDAESFATAVAADNLGNFYVSGVFWKTVNVGGTLFSSINGHLLGWHTFDILIMKYDEEGNCEWVRKTGAQFSEFITHMQAYGVDGVVCAGQFGTYTTIGGYSLDATGNMGGYTAVFVARLDAAGNWNWVKMLNPGPHVDKIEVVTALDVDSNGEVYLGGFFAGTLSLGSTNLVSDYYTGSFSSFDAFLLRLTPDGTPIWALQYGGFEYQRVHHLKIHDGDHGFFSLVGDATYGLNFVGGNPIFFASNFVDYYPFTTAAAIGRFRPQVALQLVKSPTKTSAVEGESVSLSVVVVGTSPTYQWYKNGQPILGANSSVLTIPDPRSYDEGNYTVTISNPIGSLTTAPAFLGVYKRPQFVQGPASLLVNSGDSITLSALAAGKPTPALRWFRDAGGLPEQIGDTFHLDDVTFAHDGDYTLEAVNIVGTNRIHFRISVDMIVGEGIGGYVHEGVRDVVYVSEGGEVKRFHVGTKRFLSALELGGDLGGLDVSGDGRWLVVADRSDQGVNNRVYVVNLETGTSAEVLFAKEAGEGALSGVAFGADGRVVLTSAGQLRSYDPATGNVSRQAHEGASLVRASADRQTLALLDLSNPGGSLHRYDVAGGSISASSVAGPGEDAGVARTGGQLARVNAGQATFYDGTLQTVLGALGSGPGAGPGGVAYHPQQDLVYVSWLGSTEVRAYNPTTLAEEARYVVNTQPLMTAGRVRLSRSGDLLLAEVPHGIRYVTLPAQPPVILRAPQATSINAGNTVVLGVTAYGPAGTLEYQWQKDGEDVPLAGGAQLTLVAVDSSAVGAYRVRVSNGHGFVYSEAAQLTVLQGDPLVTWNNPPDIAFGTLLGAVQLNATAVTAGTFTYEPPAGTWLPVGQGQPLRVVFTPQDTSVFDVVTNTVFLNVLKKPLTFTTSNLSREYGVANPNFPLNVFGLVAGDTLASLDVIPEVTTTATPDSPVGSYPVTISGGLDDNYAFIYGPATLTVTKRTVTIVLKELSQAYNGTPRPVSPVTSPDGVPLNITYNGVGTAPTALGTYPVTAVVGNANYQGSASGSLTIYRGSVPITWEVPAPVIVGTALGAGQLNAVAAVSGIYTYTPAAGTVLPAGVQALRLVFTPLDTVNYLRTTNNQPLVVLPLALANPQIAVGNGNEFRFEFTGVNGVEYNVEVSVDLENWSVLYSFTAAAGAVPISDPAIAANPRRFYRISPKP